jgi:hypothetical protein
MACAFVGPFGPGSLRSRRLPQFLEQPAGLPLIYFRAFA